MVWSSNDQVPYLVIDSNDELCEELKMICIAIRKQDGERVFKEYKSGERIFVKLNADLEKIKPNCELTFSICVYGFFTKPNGTSFLQMGVIEHAAKKISLLGGKRAASEGLDEPVEKKLTPGFSYTPNSLEYVNFSDDLW